MAEDVSDPIDDQRRIRRKRWTKRSGLAVTVFVVAAVALTRRAPAMEAAIDAVKATRQYAPRPNKDVSRQARDALGRFAKAA